MNNKNSIKAVPVRVFTRERPCDKVDLYLCFTNGGGAYVPRAVVEARGEIGLNAIKYLKKNGLAVQFESGSVDYWQLTPPGEQWLQEGLARFLELHPDAAARIPKRQASARTRVRRAK
ncbi:hypothetical protein FDG94_gp084 [Pseudomonas phage SM1]|uniref:Uncharacterized protein n=1 Tax=Pseudomonas phage SM1 TaxID=1772332 RepID=A0A0U3DED4_9CAUD|nr:hypothetical protein FDG94_gp084 [Pseudomonas phage SM1]ALT58077.1 hypothetical protein SM1_084 [Pseudomonas phage SM1]UGC97075.1 hypothetical protein [Pseudomonas phage BHU-1]UGV19966.1 hypothetical protein [Pseudomonas phage Pa BHU-15]UIW13595.1 hypothetical protein [Pseudomonas phage Pa BHU-17]